MLRRNGEQKVFGRPKHDNLVVADLTPPEGERLDATNHNRARRNAALVVDYPAALGQPVT